MKSSKENPCDFSLNTTEIAVEELSKKSKSIPFTPEKFLLVERLENCINLLNDKFQLVENGEELEEFKKLAKIAFLKGRLRVRIRNDEENKIAHWSIRYAVEKLDLKVNEQLINKFKYWNDRNYNKLWHLLKIEENAYSEQKDNIRDLLLYSYYQEIISDLKMEENFQTYNEIEEIYFQLVKKGLHIGKKLAYIYLYCISAVIFDDLIEEDGVKSTPEKLCEELEIDSKMYQNLIKKIFEIRDTLSREFEKVCIPPRVELSEPIKQKTLADEYLELSEIELQPKIESREGPKEKLFISQDIQNKLKEITKKLFKLKDKFQEKTLDMIIFQLYRHYYDHILSDNKQIIKVVYSSILTFDISIIEMFSEWFKTESSDLKNFSELDICKNDDFNEHLEEFLAVYQILKMKSHKKITIRNSILDYKIGKPSSKISDLEKFFITFEKDKMQNLTKDYIEEFFNKLHLLINEGQPLNPKIIMNLCFIINSINYRAHKFQIHPDVLYALSIFIVDEFYKPKKTRQIKINLLELLIKAIIIFNQPIFLYFMKNLIKNNKIDEKFVLFTERFLKPSNFNLFSITFFGRDNYSQKFRQQTLLDFSS